ncbi:hypothetical protein CN564_12930 [Bacillus pseudomycoides]|nr:hypothetical protein CN564_12930 [Bacillus pseudomycoides]
MPFIVPSFFSKVYLSFENFATEPFLFLLNYSPLNVLADCLKWEIPKYRVLLNSNGLGYPRSSYG